MKPLLYFLAWLFVAAPVFGEDGTPEFLTDFVVGDYHLIGQQADGKATYHGRVEIVRDCRNLKVKRTIAGRTVWGTATIENAPMAETTVLRFRYEESGAAYESTCLIHGDLDNHARLTCHHYRRDNTTRLPGFEALFYRSEK